MINSRLVLKQGCLDRIAEEFAKQFPGMEPVVFADANTWKVAGEWVWRLLGEPARHLYDDGVYADDAYVEETAKVLASLPGHVAVAVGSGTINDLCKRASFLNRRPYLCVATAPSVDGFTSNGAAITDHGLKITQECPAPVLVMAEPELLAGAPLDMIASGYGDLMAKVPAGADWIIAADLGIEPIDRKVWDMVQPKLKWQLAEPEALHRRCPEAIARVFDGLIHTGFAMQEYFDSRPASGADHLCSHVWEMHHIGYWKGKPASHGFKVALGTLVSTAIMTELLALSADDLRAIIADAPSPTWREREREIRTWVTLSPSVADRQVEICRQKWVEGASLAARRDRALAVWDRLRDEIRAQILPFAEVRKDFVLAGCPVEPGDLAMTRDQFAFGMRVAQMMRRRYTVLDLVYELGLMDRMVETVTGPRSVYFHTFGA